MVEIYGRRLRDAAAMDSAQAHLTLSNVLIVELTTDRPLSHACLSSRIRTASPSTVTPSLARPEVTSSRTVVPTLCVSPASSGYGRCAAINAEAADLPRQAHDQNGSGAGTDQKPRRFQYSSSPTRRSAAIAPRLMCSRLSSGGPLTRQATTAAPVATTPSRSASRPNVRTASDGP